MKLKTYHEIKTGAYPPEIKQVAKDLKHLAKMVLETLDMAERAYGALAACNTLADAMALQGPWVPYWLTPEGRERWERWGWTTPSGMMLDDDRSIPYCERHGRLRDDIARHIERWERRCNQTERVEFINNAAYSLRVALSVASEDNPTFARGIV